MPTRLLNARLLGAGVLFLCMVANYLAKPVRDAYMLEFWGVSNLPWLNIAVLVVVASSAQAQAAAFERHGAGMVTPLAGIAVLACLAVTPFISAGRVVAIVLSCGIALLNQTAFVSAWGLVDSAFEEGRARRVFASVGLGGTIGAAVGAVVATYIARWGGPPALLSGAAVAVSGFVLLSFPLARMARADPDERARFARSESADESDLKHQGWRVVTAFPYTRTILALTATISAVSATFKWGLFRLGELQPHGLPARATYFAQTNQVVAVTALLAQMIVTPLLLRRLGGGPTLLLVPCIALAGAILTMGGASAETVWWISVAFLSLEYTTNQCARELLYVPAPIEIRMKAKQHIDTTGRQVGALGANLVIGVLTRSVRSLEMLGATIAAFAVGWLFVANRARIANATLLRSAAVARPAPPPQA